MQGKGKLQDFSPDAVEKFRVRVAMDIMRLTIE